MTAVTIFQFPCGQMQDPVKDRDKHAGVVVAAEFVVQVCQDSVRTVIFVCGDSPERLGDSHEQRRRHSFARYVADSETQPVIINEEKIVEITSYLSGRLNSCVQIKFRVLGERREDPGQDTHLDVTGDLEFTLYAFLGCRGGLQIFYGMLQGAFHREKGCR